jgi:hypothetical protein
MNVVLIRSVGELTGNLNYGVFDAGDNNPSKKYDRQSCQAKSSERGYKK